MITIKSVYSGFSPFLRCLVCFRCVIVGGWDCLSVFVEARYDKVTFACFCGLFLRFELPVIDVFVDRK